VGVIDILAAERVSVSCEAEGLVADKAAAIARLSRLLTSGSAVANVERIERVLLDREELQSTGVGGGVAVPHGCVDQLEHQVGALLVCPTPIAFDAIDGEPVSILFALIGPKGAPAQHLKILARVSRLLRDAAFRDRLVRAQAGGDVYRLIVESDGGAP
jgi:PTS system nitrogen regulatory IIA component